MPSLTLNDGTNIHYEVLGSGPPVLLTPGGRSDMGRVRPHAEVLVAAGYQAIIHDRRNCGRSDVAIERRDDASFGDIMYEIYVCACIEKGLAELREGKTVPHEVVTASVREWLASSGRSLQ